MSDELKTARVTFYKDRERCKEIAIVEVRVFSLGLAYMPALRWLESHHPTAAITVKVECVAYFVEIVPD